MTQDRKLWRFVYLLPAAAVVAVGWLNSDSTDEKIKDFATRREQESGIEEVVQSETRVQVPEEAKIQKPEPKYEEPEKVDSLVAYAKYTGNFEGREQEVYDPNPNDNKSEPTIGVGHYMDRGNSRETFATVLPEVNYDAVYEGREKLSDDQINRLFTADIPEYVERTKSFSPNFDSYPEYLRQALVDGVFRGDLRDSPKTRKLINKDKWNEAADEYIDRRDYRDAETNGMRGIITRMDTNRAAMVKYAQEVNEGE